MPITICSHKNVAISCKPQNFECLCTLLKNAQPYMTVLTYNILSHSLTLGSHDLSEFYYSWLASIDWSSKLNIFSILKYFLNSFLSNCIFLLQIKMVAFKVSVAHWIFKLLFAG